MVSAPTSPARPATSPESPTTRSARQRRTDSIVGHLRLVAPESSDSYNLTQELIQSNIDVATSIASRYKNRGIDLDDLQQVALLALVNAAHRFDPDAGHNFMSFAVPTIRGEIRRHFRDSGWMIRPPRRVQEMQSRIVKAQGELEQRLGCSPRPSEIATYLGDDLELVIDALAADGMFTPTSLDGTVGDGSSSLGDLLGDDDPAMRAAEARVTLDPVVAQLSARDRRVVRLRFYEQRSQDEIADELGITQSQVSRILARLLSELRSGLNASTRPAPQQRQPTYSTPIIWAG